jgi:hypothetical protein
VGQGKAKITLKGEPAIQAAGWSLRFLLVAIGTAIVVTPICVAAAYVLVRWLLH